MSWIYYFNTSVFTDSNFSNDCPLDPGINWRTNGGLIGGLKGGHKGGLKGGLKGGFVGHWESLAVGISLCLL